MKYNHIKKVKTYKIYSDLNLDDAIREAILEAIDVAKEESCVVRLVLSIDENLEMFIFDYDTLQSVSEKYKTMLNILNKEVCNEQQ